MLRKQQAKLRSSQIRRQRREREQHLQTAQLTRLTQHLQTIHEDERGRLARSLHDELGGLLTSAQLDVARIRARLAEAGSVQSIELLAHLVETLDSGVELSRRLIEDLRPSALDNLGLATAIEILANEFAARSGMQVHLGLQPVVLDEDTELMVYRIVQEAVSNVDRHAGATQVWVSLLNTDGHVEASVRDDGNGFDTHTLQHSVYGLMDMRFRVEAAGGSLVVASDPGQGTLIRMRLAAQEKPS